VHFGCSHCGWTGGEYYNSRTGNGADLFVAIYDYVDENGALAVSGLPQAGQDISAAEAGRHRSWLDLENRRRSQGALPFTEIVEAISRENAPENRSPPSRRRPSCVRA
jgi:hypothetical protein